MVLLPGKKKVRTWNVAESQLFAYLKNAPPGKASACKRVNVLPTILARCATSLISIGARSTARHTEVGEDETVEQVHDRDSAFLPRNDVWCCVSGDDSWV